MVQQQPSLGVGSPVDAAVHRVPGAATDPVTQALGEGHRLSTLGADGRGRIGGDMGGHSDESSPPAAGAAPAGARRAARLTRPLILAAAIELVDREGLAELTMRRLGSVLHVQAMSLYAHVPSREDLLDGMVEAVVDELYADPDVYLEPRHGWEDYLTRIAHGVRRIALTHPRLFPLVATRPPAAPWVRPPLRSLRWMDSFLSGLVGVGFSDPAAAAIYRAFTSFLLGHLLLDVAGRNVDTSAVADSSPGLPDGQRAGDDTTAARAPDPLADYPDLRRMEPYLSRDDSDGEFDRALQVLLQQVGELLGNTGAAEGERIGAADAGR